MRKIQNMFRSKKSKIIAALVVVVVIAAAVTAAQARNSNCLSSNGKSVNHGISGHDLAQDPAHYKCQAVELTGRVFNTQKSGDQKAVQVWADADNSEDNIVVMYTTGPELKNDDYVRFTGVVGGKFDGENAFGGDVAAAVVQASSIQKIDRDEAVAPALTTITPNVSQTKSNLTITIKKIEFAANETRLFVAVKNDGDATANVYSFNTKLVQNGSQVKTKDIYTGDNSADLPSDIVAHTTETGKMYFEKADPAKPLTISLEGMVETDYQTLDYNFTIQP